MKRLFIFFIFLFSITSYLYAESTTDSNELDGLRQELKSLKSQFEEMKSNYENKINQLESKIEQLNQQAPATETKPIPVTQASQTSMARYFQNFNPDISVIGDFTYHHTDNKNDEQYNQFQLRQAELAFSASVDPYARADLFLHVEPHDGDWKVGLCEGYMTLLDLPIKNLQAKIGKFKADFGKVNRLHLHSLPWVDYPNVLTNYFGEEGMSEPGISASYLIPNPWNHYAELTFEVMNNHNSTSFAGSEGKDMVYLSHLKNFFDINEESTLELGGSFAAGPNDNSSSKNKTYLEGVDLTYKWRPLKEGLYKSIVFQNELLYSQKDNVGDDENGRKQIDTWGMYSSLQYQFAKRWSTFGRYDYSGFPDYSNRHDNAFSTGLTFAQSEYCFWRLQFKRTCRDYDKDINEFWLQCDFGLGPHRKHEY